MSFSDHFAVPFTRSTNALNPHFTASPPSMGVKWDEMTMMISSMERGELTAGETVADHLRLPTRGEAGMKLIRRSVATILRDRLPMDAWGEIEMFLGHDRFDDVSDLYAPFRPTICAAHWRQSRGLSMRSRPKRPALTTLLPQPAGRLFASEFRIMPEIRGLKWWAWQGLNLRPLRCQHKL